MEKARRILFTGELRKRPPIYCTSRWDNHGATYAPERLDAERQAISSESCNLHRGRRSASQGIVRRCRFEIQPERNLESRVGLAASAPNDARNGMLRSQTPL